MTYFSELQRAMSLLADHGATFFGQAVGCPGTAMYETLKHIREDKRVELPVAEDMQMGLAVGVALGGGLPVCCYPRIGFMLLAINQLVLHLDKIPIYSAGGYIPKVIIRTAIPTDKPLHPQAQHVGYYLSGIRLMLTTVCVEELFETRDIMPAYERALNRTGSTLLVEHTGRYDDK